MTRDDRSPESTRRAIVAAMSVLGGSGLAGCLGDEGDPSPSPTATASRSPTPSPTPPHTPSALDASDVAHVALEGQRGTVGFTEGADVSVVSAPEQGNASIQDGALQYDPGTGYNGYDAFRYEIAGDGASDTATVRITTYAEASARAPLVQLPRRSIRADELAVVRNPNDEYSRSVTEYYADARDIPDENVIDIELPPEQDQVSAATLVPQLAEARNALPDRIQGYALTWKVPFRMSNTMGITTAFAHDQFLVDRYTEAWDYHTKMRIFHNKNDYYDSESVRPADDHGMRPAMMIAMPETDEKSATEGAKDLIDRGIAADGTMPTGTGYLYGNPRAQFSTGVRARHEMFERAAKYWGEEGPLDIGYTEIEGRFAGKNDNGYGLQNADDVLLYMIGRHNVPKADTNSYRPGAVADNFNIWGGLLKYYPDPGNYMNAMHWLRAGATATFGGTYDRYEEGRRSNPHILLDHYYRGNTVLEAYWKSVWNPYMGVFVGEPLARPWGRSTLREEDRTLSIETTWLAPQASYTVEVRPDPDGEWSPTVEDVTVEHHGPGTIDVENATGFEYRLRADGRPTPERPVPGSIDVPKLNSVPSADGKREDVWDAALQFDVPTHEGQDDFSGTGWVGWTEHALHVFVRITDRSVIEDDELTIGIGPANSDAADLTDEQYRFEYPPDNDKLQRWYPGAIGDGARYRETASGYAYEITIPWDEVSIDATVGASLGLQFQFVDEDDGQLIKYDSSWPGPGLVRHPYSWGTATLVE